MLIGAAAGEAVGIAMDKKDVKNSTRNRMIQPFVAKLRQEENQDSIGKALKDIALMRFSMAAKYIIRYVGLVSACPVCSGGTCGASDYCCYIDYL